MNKTEISMNYTENQTVGITFITGGKKHCEGVDNGRKRRVADANKCDW